LRDFTGVDANAEEDKIVHGFASLYAPVCSGRVASWAPTPRKMR